EIIPRVPALAYRMCLVARGAIDFAVAAENSHDWDIAAADLLLEESGARLARAAPLQFPAGPPWRAPCCVGRGRAPSQQGLSRRNQPEGGLTGGSFQTLAFSPPRGQRPPRRAALFRAPSRKCDHELTRREGPRRGKAAALALGVRRRAEIARKPRIS